VIVRYLEARIEFGEHWLWTGPKNRDGYGMVKAARWKDWLAHRLVWVLLVGDIPEGHVLDHRCRVRNCVRPDHLRTIPKSENDAQRWEHAETGPRRGVCPRGHREYVWRRGRWRCNGCNREDQRERRRAKK